MILFDGMYSLGGVILSLLSLMGSIYINKKDYEKYPFGKKMIEPLIVIIKSLAIFIMCIYSLTGSIKDLINGGNEVQYGYALIYALISTLGCGIAYFFLKKKGKAINSSLVNIESSQWLMDTLLSLGVLVGFLIANIIKHTEFIWFNRYLDPLMVIICSSVFIKMPIKSFGDGLKELLEFKADDSITLEIDKLVEGIEREYNFEDTITRVSKTGNDLRIEIDFIYNEESNIKVLDEMDGVREKIFNSLSHINYEKWLNVSFTKDKKWAI
ncbi:cation transporter [Clostridium perfringens]|uniref:cation diffusion facilitator family transporter n=1 Tax=Clostridium perfringens TaxID=1502 RepID=UPI002246EAD2|nr:cation transporter [Clostridium perfringens]EJT6663158.1 cation transporter [Clostridium perfringens]ELC8428346.1 cation transporter [Clostridium perfringens]MCX0356962.1 cation transporter [Clostridium perfringens]MCX0406961.1 cation transporter [Clostridium perfringens]MCX0417932.1 cation transporter [Clostridium perfringens]